MAEIVNLRRARKAKARVAAKDAAALNRVKFGQTRAERIATELDAARLRHALDGVKRED